MGYVLRMSGEIRDWLAGLRDGEPRTGGAIVHALIVLVREGPSLGPPTVVPLDRPPPLTNPLEALDYAYQERLERLRELRASAADAGHFAAAQAELDAFRNKKETLKARHAAAV